MAVVTKATLKTYFQDGKEPDENKFIDFIDTMAEVGGVVGSFTVGGNLNVGIDTGGRVISINGGASTSRMLLFQTAGNARWAVETGSDAESGSNAGSTFKIHGYADNGVWLGEWMRIRRADGWINIADTIEVAETVLAKGHNPPSSGVGLEMHYTGGSGIIMPYDHGASVYKTMEVRGNPTTIYGGGAWTTFDAADIYTTYQYQNWAGSSTIVGWADLNNSYCLWFKLVGKTCHIRIDLDGTSGGSDGTVARCSLPFQSANDVNHEVLFRSFNNNVYDTVYGVMQLVKNTQVAHFFRQAGAWTASGRKIVRIQFDYQIN